MRLKLTARALRDLANLTSYIAVEQQNPQAAWSVLERIELALERIQTMPYIGRECALPNTRELVIANLPFSVVYRVRTDTVEVLTVFHTSQDPDKKFE